MQPGEVRGGQLSLCLGLEARVGRAVTPTIPARACAGVAHDELLRAQVCLDVFRSRDGGAEIAAAGVDGYGAPLRGGEGRRLRLHFAVRECVENRVRRKLRQQFTRESPDAGNCAARVAGFQTRVTGGANALEYRLAARVLLRCLRRLRHLRCRRRLHPAYQRMLRRRPLAVRIVPSLRLAPGWMRDAQ